MCASDANNLDQNGNGIPQGEEGTCCVEFSNDRCYKLTGNPETDCIDEVNGGAVPCDKLLFYGGMVWEMDTDSDPDVAIPNCGPSPVANFPDCICYTVGDYDNDGDDLGDVGPWDNCPEEAAADQTNSDADLWGDPCDYCFNTPDVVQIDQCDPTQDTCQAPAPPGARQNRSGGKHCADWVSGEEVTLLDQARRRRRYDARKQGSPPARKLMTAGG